ncbi:unnamed protein product [Alternaria sp. RS040]
MALLSGQTAWIVLPCILLSLFAARFLLEESASPEERGLMILAKAALVFFITLVLATRAANFLFHPAPSPTQPPNRNVLLKKRKVSPAIEEDVRSWRETDSPKLRWSSDSSDEVKEEVKRRRKEKKKKTSRKKKESDTDKSLRKSLFEMFKPKRYEMLGMRRETVEEVVREDPLL